MADWDFGGAFLHSMGEAQRQDVFGRQAAIAEERAPADLAHVQALARLQNAQAGEAEMRADAERQMAALMQSTQLSSGTPSEQFAQLAIIAARSGATTAAKDFMLRSVQAGTSEAARASHEATSRRAEIAADLKKAELFNQYHGVAKNAEDWANANMLYQQATGEAVPPELLEYDPRKAELMRQAGLKLHDEIRLEQQERDTRSRIAARAERAMRGKMNYDLRVTEAERRERVRQDKEKAGGKDVGAPSSAQISAAKSVLAADKTLDFEDEDEKKTAAFDLAAEARALQKRNPGLDAGEALARAFAEQKLAGAYVTAAPKQLFGKDIPGTGGKTSYSHVGTTPRTPIVLQGRPDPSKLQRGRYYNLNGKTYKFLGDGKFEAAGAPSPLPLTSDDKEN